MGLPLRLFHVLGLVRPLIAHVMDPSTIFSLRSEEYLLFLQNNAQFREIRVGRLSCEVQPIQARHGSRSDRSD